MVIPRKVEPDAAARALVVLWADGHESRIPYQRLRDMCPCARCHEARGKGRMRPLPMAATTRLDAVKRVGNYGLNFEWGDSHSEGIFVYDFLRGLCPCGACVMPARYAQ
jgi:DUF971 family protein